MGDGGVGRVGGALVGDVPLGVEDVLGVGRAVVEFRLSDVVVLVPADIDGAEGEDGRADEVCREAGAAVGSPLLADQAVLAEEAAALDDGVGDDLGAVLVGPCVGDHPWRYGAAHAGGAFEDMAAGGPAAQRAPPVVHQLGNEGSVVRAFEVLPAEEGNEVGVGFPEPGVRCGVLVRGSGEGAFEAAQFGGGVCVCLHIGVLDCVVGEVPLEVSIRHIRSLALVPATGPSSRS
ncbi:hypothetical protein ABZ516_32515 [Streptomyces sp. NPDC019826]|uniref:hypothetical protein n=1 Tax=Streptomyces sp. NPDC019826 TaxID=3156667 RepID=UPI0034043FDB